MPRILLVDDNQIVRETLLDMLSIMCGNEELTFLQASDGESALEIIAETAIDGILLDVRMPGIDGFEVCRRLKGNEATRHIPVTFLSGEADWSQLSIRAKELGALGLVAKPVSATALAGHVRSMLKSQRIEADLRNRTLDLEGRLVNQGIQLDQARGEFLEFLEGTRDLISVINSTGRFLYANGLHEELLGHTLREISGMGIYDLVKEPDRELLGETLAVLSSGGTAPLIEIEIQTAAGEGLPVEIQCSRVKRNSGEETAFRLVARDIRERRNLRRQLEIRVQELEQTNAYKTRFLAGMSHEFFTPLTAIVNYVRFVLIDDPPPRDEHRADLQRALSAAEYLEELMNTVLDMAQIESGTIPIREEDVNLARTAESVVWGIHSKFEDKGLDLSWDIPDGLPPIVSDTVRIKQILLNLLTNACRYTDAGTVEIRIRKDENHVRLDVKDTGIGITANRISVLFDEFQQVHDTTKRRGGRGLGLALSKRLATLLGGNLTVQSVLGEGSTFTLKLPLDRTGIAIARIPDGQWILIASPAAAVRTAAAAGLESLGFSVLPVGDLDLVRTILARQSPRGVILDETLAVPQVLSLLERFDEAHTFCPVLVMAGEGTPVLASGTDPVLIKPVGASRLAWYHTRSWLKRGLASGFEIVVVDDDEDQRLLMEIVFERTGCTVRSFSHAAPALSWMQENLVGLFVVDLMIPDMDGFELVRRIREHSPHIRTPLVVLTGRDVSDVESRWILERTDGILLKQDGDLVRMVQELIDGDSKS